MSENSCLWTVDFNKHTVSQCLLDHLASRSLVVCPIVLRSCCSQTPRTLSSTSRLLASDASLSDHEHDALNVGNPCCRQQIKGWMSSEVCGLAWSVLGNASEARQPEDLLAFASKHCALIGEVLPNPAQSNAIWFAQDADACSVSVDLETSALLAALCTLSTCPDTEKSTSARGTCRTNLSTCRYRQFSSFHAKLARSLVDVIAARRSLYLRHM